MPQAGKVLDYEAREASWHLHFQCIAKPSNAIKHIVMPCDVFKGIAMPCDAVWCNFPTPRDAERCLVTLILSIVTFRCMTLRLLWHSDNCHLQSLAK